MNNKRATMLILVPLIINLGLVFGGQKSDMIKRVQIGDVLFQTPNALKIIQFFKDDWSCHTCVDDADPKRKWPVVPGTKWCGPGDVASSYNDLGSFTEEDKCCREHDHCPKYVLPFQCNRFGCNNSMFTKSSCDCDRKFKKCLAKVKSSLATAISAVYFAVMPNCFKSPKNAGWGPWAEQNSGTLLVRLG